MLIEACILETVTAKDQSPGEIADLAERIEKLASMERHELALPSGCDRHCGGEGCHLHLRSPGYAS